MFLGCWILNRKNTSDTYGFYVSKATTSCEVPAAADLGKIKFDPVYAREIGEVIDEISEYRSKPTIEKLWQGGRWVRRKRRKSEGRKNEMKRGGRNRVKG